MKATFEVRFGTGLAKCQVCGKAILKDELAVVAKGYMSGGQAHIKCLDRAAVRAALDAVPKVEVR